jgi:hypothetical protein
MVVTAFVRIIPHYPDHLGFPEQPETHNQSLQDYSEKPPYSTDKPKISYLTGQRNWYTPDIPVPVVFYTGLFDIFLYLYGFSPKGSQY